MMTLSTVPVVTDALNSINVHWSTGLKNHGIVSVQFSSESRDQALIAELITIRHLLFTQYLILFIFFQPLVGSRQPWSIQASRQARVLECLQTCIPICIPQTLGEKKPLKIKGLK